jgi:small subunit ribosomal protein S21
MAKRLIHAGREGKGVALLGRASKSMQAPVGDCHFALFLLDALHQSRSERARRRFSVLNPWLGPPGELRARPVCEVRFFMQIIVRDNNVDQALRALKKKLQREGVYREMKLRRHYEKPSEKRAREKAAAIRRARKLERKRMERDGIK